MEQSSDYMTAERYQTFLGGLITTIKINDKYTDCSKKEIRILGKTIIKREVKRQLQNLLYGG